MEGGQGGDGGGAPFGDEGGGMGGGGPWRAGQGGGEGGGGTREQCGSNKNCTGFNCWDRLKKVATGLIWLVTRVAGWGEAWGGGPWRAGKGGRWGGAPESSVGATAPLKT